MRSPKRSKTSTRKQWDDELFGEFTFQGAYVYRLSLENGFELQGRITHQTPSNCNNNKDTWYWGSSNTDITRALFIGDTSVHDFRFDDQDEQSHGSQRAEQFYASVTNKPDEP